jgi:hypothetical protein
MTDNDIQMFDTDARTDKPMRDHKILIVGMGTAKETNALLASTIAERTGMEVVVSPDTTSVIDAIKECDGDHTLVVNDSLLALQALSDKGMTIGSPDPACTEEYPLTKKQLLNRPRSERMADVCRCGSGKKMRYCCGQHF